MKKKELGITKGEAFSYKVDDRVVITTLEKEICEMSYGRAYESTYEEMHYNTVLIADAFNTANKCGLLPSELLEQNTLLLEALIQIRTVGGLYLDGKLSKIIRDTINQIEQ